MGKPLSPLELTNLGVYGLNTQANAASLEPQWLTKADNTMLDSEGRITYRKGFEQISDNVGSTSSNTEIIRSLGQYRNSSVEKIFAGAGDKIYYLDTSTSPDTLTDVTGSITTPTDGNWQFTNFNNDFYGVQSGHKPIKYDGTNWLDLEDVGTGAAGDAVITGDAVTSVTVTAGGVSYITVPTVTFTGGGGTGATGTAVIDGGEVTSVTITAGGSGYTTEPTVTFSDNYAAPTGVTTFNPTSILGEFGRLWVGGVAEEKDVVHYSDTLIGYDFSGGLAGSIDLKSVWGGDEITALASFNGQLVIFGKRNIVIYNGADDPSTMSLDEVISGIGCVARGSVQAMGDDIIFLSGSGLRSLNRTKIQDKMPLLDYSKNIKDELTNLTANQNMDYVKAQYCLCGGFYILSFTNVPKTYIFDFKYKNPDSSPRITQWSTLAKRAPKSFLSTIDGTLYLGLGNNNYEGRVAKYNGYYDKEYNGSTWSNIDYTGTFKTVWMDFGSSGVTKILKRLFTVFNGGKNLGLTFKWFKDYDSSPLSSVSVPLNISSAGEPFLWGASNSLYGSANTGENPHTHVSSHVSAKYAPIYGATKKTIPLSGSVDVVQFEMSGNVNGYKGSLQHMAVTTKQGRIR